MGYLSRNSLTNVVGFRQRLFAIVLLNLHKLSLSCTSAELGF